MSIYDSTTAPISLSNSNDHKYLRTVETPYGFVQWFVTPCNGGYVLLTGELNDCEIGARQIDKRATRQTMRAVALELTNDWRETEAQHRDDTVFDYPAQQQERCPWLTTMSADERAEDVARVLANDEAAYDAYKAEMDRLNSEVSEMAKQSRIQTYQKRLEEARDYEAALRRAFGFARERCAESDFPHFDAALEEAERRIDLLEQEVK